jgi:alkylated DNA repair dioxygenase AlkB
MASRSTQRDLFGDVPQLPEGFVYEPAFLSREEEETLLAVIRDLPLAEAKYKEYTARRRTVSYGGKFDYDRNVLDKAAPIPELLFPLREKVARWVGIPAEDFVHGLVSEYRPGTPLGWHRDVPDFEAIVGVSLLGSARMKLRPYKPGERNSAKDSAVPKVRANRAKDVIDLDLPPRSAYSIRGAARWEWQHSIVATKELRYSVTFRTARK